MRSTKKLQILIMLQDKYYFSKHEDVISFIRQSEQDFHKNHTPLYANYLFCNPFTMSKIEKYLANDPPEGTKITVFPVFENDCEMLDNGTLSCGMELINGKVDFETTCEIAKHSQNVLIYSLDSLNDDDLILVRDDSLLDNTLILKYIPDSGEDDDTETVYSPDEKRICTLV